MADERRMVAVSEWVDAVSDARSEGCRALVSIGAVDELGQADEIRVECHLRGAGRSIIVETRVPRGETPETAGELASLTSILPGAAWYEREIHDFFGVRFRGDEMWRLDEPLLNRAGGAPLRKDVPLAARAAAVWPGAKEPGADSAPSRRRMVPPGVPDPELWGDRDPNATPPAAVDIATSLTGGRVRRRRP